MTRPAARSAAPPFARTRTCSIRGSPPGWRPTPTSAGPTTPRTCVLLPHLRMQMGYDIMFFWCARMIMFGLYNMRDRGPENEVPFRTVLFHGLIRDATARR